MMPELSLAAINNAFLTHGCQAKAIQYLTRPPKAEAAPDGPSKAQLHREAQRQKAIEAVGGRIEWLRMKVRTSRKPRKWQRELKAKLRAVAQIERADKKKADRPFVQYKALVWKLTREEPLHLLKGFEKRSWKGLHVDHVLSIAEGFKRGLPPETLAHISNLRMLPAKENLGKGTKTVFTNLFNETTGAKCATIRHGREG